MNHRSFFILFFGVTLSGSPVCAQTAQIDSLRQLLPAASGEVRLKILSVLSDKVVRYSPSEALAFGREGIALAQLLGDETAEAEIVLNNAFSYSTTGEYVEALRMAKQGLEQAQRLGNKRLIATGRGLVGIVFAYLGQYSKALENHSIALQLRQELGVQREVVATLNNIGLVYRYIGQYDKAVVYHEQALRFREETRDTMGIILCLQNIGYAESQQHKLQAAMSHYERALLLSRAINYTHGVAAGLANLGLVYRQQGDIPTAHRYLEDAVLRYQALNLSHGLAQTLNTIGSMYQDEGSPAKAIEYYNRAVAAALPTHLLLPLKDSYTALHSIYRSAGNNAKAFETFSHLTAVKDSLFNQSESRKLADALIQFEASQKNHEIEILNRARTINELTLQNQRAQRNMLIAAIVFAVLVTLSVAWRFRFEKGNKQLLEEKNGELAQLNNELQEKISQVRIISGLIPVCSHCRKLRNDQGYWQSLDAFIVQHSDAILTHGICPECTKRLYPEYAERLELKKKLPPPSASGAE